MIQIFLCDAEEKRQIESYQALVRLMETIHIDNMKVLNRLLIHTKDDQLPLVECPTKRKVVVYPFPSRFSSELNFLYKDHITARSLAVDPSPCVTK